MRVRHTATGKVYRVVEMRLLPVTGDPAERQPIVVDADELLTPGQGEWLIEDPLGLCHGEPPVLRYERHAVVAGPCCEGCGYEPYHSPACPHGAGGTLRHIVKPLRGVW